MDSGVYLKTENPKKTANILSKLFFTWMIDLYRKATKTGIEVSDLYRVLENDSSQRLGDQLETNWNIELNRAKIKGEEPKLLNAITRTFFWSYMIWGAILFVQHVGLRTFQPVVLSYLISLFADNGGDTTPQMYISASILVAISSLVVLSMHHCNFGQAAIGMRIRIGVSSLLYRKTLKLSRKSLGQTGVGKVVNLLSNDVTRFDLVTLTLHYLWIMPFQTSLITYLMWQEVQISCLVGVLSVAILSLPVQGYLGKLTSNLRLRVAQRTDYRVTLMSEIISGIQVIKMYAWEKPFDLIARLARDHEVKALSLASYLRGVYLSFMIFVERVALFLTTVTYVLMGNDILAAQVFSLAQFFNLLQLTMAIFYPMSITYGAETLVAIDRLQEFLMQEENEETTIEKDPSIGVVLNNVDAAWKPETITLKGINLEIPVGSLCVIIGPVGSGKSSFLHLLLGELQAQSGTVKVQGEITYASQEPWLFASTVRNNILFGQEFDKRLYNKVVKTCALQKDFDQLPLGDKTLVGERGAALSGGQKARVNLARAVYREADIYLLDDPLSAVDPHVGKHLFEKCILFYLRNKTRILVTHQLQYLKKADLIILINEGGIEAQGTYDELRARNLNFTAVLEKDEHSTTITGDKDLTIENVIDSAPLERRSSFLLSSSLLIESVEVRSDPVQNEEEIIPAGSSPFLEYVKSSGNCCSMTVIILLILGSQIACSCSDYWVTYWTQKEAMKSLNKTKAAPLEYVPLDGSSFDHSSIAYNNVQDKSDPNGIDTYFAIYVYTALIVSATSLTLIRSLTYFKMAMTASRNLHNRMFSALLEAPMKFFNTNPSGRILNRFSKDMGAVDEILPKVLLESIQISLIMCGILVMVVISNVYMIVAIIVLGYFFIKMRSLFITTSKNIKHLEGITKSPMFSHLNSSLNGMTTIRAFHAGEMLKGEFDAHQDTHTSAWFMTITCMVSFGLWLDIICVTFIACTTFSFIILNHYGQVSGSLVGLAISQSLILTGMLQYGIRQTAEVINQLTSVERILHYTKIEKEGPFETYPHNIPQSIWPSKGHLQMEEVYLQYSLDEPPVLKNLNFKIKPGEKIGIVGRTGAGKSSLIAALFRLTDFDGTIYIDGVDTKSLGLHDLRSKISIIPQEPVLFSASLRYNLDPFDEFHDDKLWEVLEEVELKESIQSLDMIVAGGGRNFSVGQRQLVCLARAILRDNKILVLDEATANIDPNTDSLIQETIRKKFKNCTVLTVAHRLNTIMDSNKVIVMEAGEIIEFDYPYKLLQNPDSTFYQMAMDAGLSMSAHLEDMALDAFLHKTQ